MTIDKFVIDWITTAFLLLYEKEREVRKLYNAAFALKRKVKNSANSLSKTTTQLIKNEITKEEWIKFNLEYNEAVRKLNFFLQYEFAPKEKEIRLQLDSLNKQLNDVLKQKQRLHLKLTTQKVQQKKKGPK